MCQQIMMDTPEDDHNVAKIDPTPRAGDSAKKRRITEEEMIALARELSAFPPVDSPYNNEQDPFDLQEMCSSLPTSPISPVRRRSSGSVTIATAETQANRLRREESEGFSAAYGQRPSFRPAKRTSPSNSPSSSPVAPTSTSPLSLSFALCSLQSEASLGPPPTPNKYILGDTIGEGGAGLVRKAIDRESGAKVAVKTLRHAESPHEVAALQACDGHPHILRLMDQFHHDGELHLVTELASEDLLQHIERNGPLSEDKARILCKDLLSAVSTLHEAGYCHRDIKLENLLLNNTHQLVLADLGTAAPTKTDSGKSRRHHDAVGSRCYMAPEVVQSDSFGSEYEGSAADVWSCGIVVYAMTAGMFPFAQASPDCAQYCLHCHGKHVFPSHLSEELVDLQKKMLGIKGERATIQEILTHSWFNTAEVH